MCYKRVVIIGLTGRNAAGKGIAADYFKSKGFYYCSLSDVIRGEVRGRQLEVTREQLIGVGNELRAKHGTGYLARRILESIQEDKNYAVDSFRHPDEVEVFRGRRDFHLLAIEADAAVRFARIKKRGRESDPATLEQFKTLEERELTSAASHGQQLLACQQLADFRMINEGTVEELQQEIHKLLRQLMRNLNRPGWDEYFMKLAKVASLRSNCVKRKVAAIIVRDKRVVSTGYNGTPRGTKNCYEGGCPRCNSLADSGTQLEECFCSHGEENAITQAAYHGVSVKGATLYTTFAPCLMCTKMIINAGIREVVYNLGYPLNETSFKLFQEVGVTCRQQRVE